MNNEEEELRVALSDRVLSLIAQRPGFGPLTAKNRWIMKWWNSASARRTAALCFYLKTGKDVNTGG